MKIEKKMTEDECRDLKIPYFNTKEELFEFIESLDILNDDYGTAAYGMSLAATAAFNYIAHKFGCTGFQAQYADMDILRRTRLIKGPFMIINLENHLYPQYNLIDRLEKAIDENTNWFKEQAATYLKENPDAHPSVIAHWNRIIAMPDYKEE